MPSWRKCVFGCEQGDALFTLPKDELTRQLWTEFMFGDRPPPAKTTFVCLQHFTDDCFTNKSLFQSGQVSKLSLRPGAVPSIRRGPYQCTLRYTNGYFTEHLSPQDFQPESSPPLPAEAGSLGSTTVRQHRYHSKGVQATVTMTSRATETGPEEVRTSGTSGTCGTSGTSGTSGTCGTSGTSGTGERPTKRPRVSTPAADLSKLIAVDSEDQDQDEDLQYPVFESCLRELFEECPVCQKHCRVQKLRRGTFVAFGQDCPHCGFSRKWQNQPSAFGAAVGNLRTSAAVYFPDGAFLQTDKDESGT